MTDQKDNGDSRDGQEDGATFDMYHFISRKDVIAAAVLILVLLIYLVFRLLAGPEVV